MSTSTITADQLYQEIQQLPVDRLPELASFIKFLRFQYVLAEAKPIIAKVQAQPTQPHRHTAYSFSVHPQRAVMQGEVDAFEAQRAMLWERFPNQYIALHGGQVVDNDVDELALLARIEANYPHQIVLIRQATKQSPPDLVLRSPRFAN